MKTYKIEEFAEQNKDKLIEVGDDGAIRLVEPKKKWGRWKPKREEEYWYMDSFGNVNASNWDALKFDIYAYKKQPLFKAKEKAIFAGKLQKRMMELSMGQEVWLDDNTSKYILCVSWVCGKPHLKISYCEDKQYNTLHFSTKNIDILLSEYTENAILKYHFGIVEVEE